MEQSSTRPASTNKNKLQFVTGAARLSSSASHTQRQRGALPCPVLSPTAELRCAEGAATAAGPAESPVKLSCWLLGDFGEQLLQQLQFLVPCTHTHVSPSAGNICQESPGHFYQHRVVLPGERSTRSSILIEHKSLLFISKVPVRS